MKTAIYKTIICIFAFLIISGYAAGQQVVNLSTIYGLYTPSSFPGYGATHPAAAGTFSGMATRGGSQGTAIPAGSVTVIAVLVPEIPWTSEPFTVPAGWELLPGSTPTNLAFVNSVPWADGGDDFMVEIPVRAVAARSSTASSAGMQINLFDDNFTETDFSDNNRASSVTVADNSLPVSLGDFTANREGNTVKLDWYTTLEENSAYFEVQHSRDAQNWQKLGQVTSHRDSKERNNYSYTHTMPASGINYYRLKMVDLDLSYTYSDIKSVRMNGVAAETVKVYPNPVTSGLLTIETAGGVPVKQVEILNGAGVRLYTVPAGKGAVTTLPVEHYPAGVYTTRLLYEDGSVSAHRVIVAK
ncbi:hypothetical protein GCM10023091_06370 [Ravibacter arvi]|uniref:T9SS type A sorting domain-containing protein n=1 Tax=Ravibacter arvi TaxID=2051041 RepID=A0ABP8LQB7_9BACT